MYDIHPPIYKCPFSRRTVCLLYITKALRKEVILDKCNRKFPL